MKFSEWLDAQKGRTKAVALHFSVSLGAVTQWRVAVPRHRMRELMEFTRGEVGFDGMLPATASVHGRVGLEERRQSQPRRESQRRTTPERRNGNDRRKSA